MTYPKKPQVDEVDEQEYQQILLGDREARAPELAGMEYEDVNHCPHGVPYDESCALCLETLKHELGE